MTVTELAKLTGYSISTVSKALSDSGEISREAKEIILRAARETGYYDKAIKRKKRIGMPNTVGIATSDIRDSMTLSRLCRALRNYGFYAVVCDEANATYILCDVLGVDAVIFSDVKETECSVPCCVHRGDADGTAAAVASLLGEETVETAKEKKEDIWLF
ncbi:MAG: LacI family DNA-binding transcriptional regulator [Clostridia bacterium]|nr:LacI family DNA-binding transcriptional regulator [Clostridia bacterium]